MEFSLRIVMVAVVLVIGVLIIIMLLGGWSQEGKGMIDSLVKAFGKLNFFQQDTQSGPSDGDTPFSGLPGTGS